MASFEMVSFDFAALRSGRTVVESVYPFALTVAESLWPFASTVPEGLYPFALTVPEGVRPFALSARTRRHPEER